MILSYTNNFPTSGLTNYYTFDDNSIDRIAANNGVETNVVYTTGKINKAASFFSNGAASRIIISTINYQSVSFWFYASSSSGVVYESILSDLGGNLGLFWKPGTQQLSFYSSGDNTNTTPLNYDTWYHIVLTHDGNGAAGNLVFYINGISDGTYFVPSPFAESIGNDNANERFNGLLDELGFYNRALTTDEINLLYNGNSGFQYQYPKILNHNNKIISNNSLLLDSERNAFMAYSVRKLRSAYRGSCMRVRRSSDNTETDIGFNYLGGLDTTTLLSFVGANNGLVTILYDQSGNGYDMFQTGTTLQPFIISAGTVFTINNKPALFVNDTGFLHLPTTGTTIGTEYSLFGVLQHTGLNREWLGGSGSNMYGVYFDTFTKYHNATDNLIGNNYWTFAGPTYTINTQYIVQLHRNNLDATLHLNENSVVGNNPNTNNKQFDVFSLYSENGGTFSNGFLQETIIYNTDRSSGSTEFYNNIKNYFN